jgi:hypothetical protein
MIEGLMTIAMLVFGLVILFVLQCWPQILASIFEGRQEQAEKQWLQQQELARKNAIADAAIAARARGEKFVPPADYDR